MPRITEKLTLLARNRLDRQLTAALPLVERQREATVLAERAARAQEVQAYAGSSYQFITEELRIAPHWLKWSLNPGYATHIWDGTVDPLIVLLDALDRGERRIAVESAVGTQKTYTAACMALAFLAKFPGATVVTLAPKEGQLKANLWKEINNIWPAFLRWSPSARIQNLYIERRAGDLTARMFGYGAQVGAGEVIATKAQGIHGPDMLFLYEEMPGIADAVLAAFDLTASARHNIQVGLGNPDSKQDPLHQMATRDGAVHIRISAHDHPNIVCRDDDIVPGAITQVKLDDIAASYGGQDSVLYKSRARGLSPDEAQDALIKRAWLLTCVARANDETLLWTVQGRLKNPKPKSLGVDVANAATGDKAAISYWQGDVCTKVETLHVGDGHVIRDCNMLGAYVVGLARELGIDAEHIGVDSVGVGAGTVNEMRRLRVECQALGGADKPVRNAEQEETFQNLRGQMYWQAREDIRTAAIGVPLDEELFQDLTEVRFETKGGKIVIESKEDLKRRLGRSPDKGDAFVYGNWVRHERGYRSAGALVARF